MASPHANAQSEAFTHWNTEGEIPGNCAVCHSGIGLRDFVGADGSAAGSVDNPVPVGTTVDCDTCHADESKALASVTFPSGAEMSGLGKGAVCMVCHQGRESTPSVNSTVAGLPDDEPSSDLGFINIHYRAAAATLMGTEVKGAYEYDGKTYMGRLTHVPMLTTCTDCHNPHSLKVDFQFCSGCHKVDGLDAIRVSTVDYDGNGDTTEGIAAEIERLQARLDDAIRDYAAEVTQAPIVYADTYPYYFADTNADGVADADETVVPNRYQSWTPRLLKAAYNYQFVAKDPGAFAHNPHYALQILFDSIEDLDAVSGGKQLDGLIRP